jgi:hypothetical protein
MRARPTLFLIFLHHIKWHITVGKKPLDEGSARRRDLYLTTQATHKRQASLPRRDSNQQSQQAIGHRDRGLEYYVAKRLVICAGHLAFQMKCCRKDCCGQGRYKHFGWSSQTLQNVQVEEWVCITKTSKCMLYREIITVHCNIHTDTHDYTVWTKCGSIYV